MGTVEDEAPVDEVLVDVIEHVGDIISLVDAELGAPLFGGPIPLPFSHPVHAALDPIEELLVPGVLRRVVPAHHEVGECGADVLGPAGMVPVQPRPNVGHGEGLAGVGLEARKDGVTCVRRHSRVNGKANDGSCYVPIGIQDLTNSVASAGPPACPLGMSGNKLPPYPRTAIEVGDHIAAPEVDVPDRTRRWFTTPSRRHVVVDLIGPRTPDSVGRSTGIGPQAHPC